MHGPGLRIATVGASGHAVFVLEGLKSRPDDYRRMLDAEKPEVVAVNPFFCDHSLRRPFRGWRHPRVLSGQ